MREPEAMRVSGTTMWLAAGLAQVCPSRGTRRPNAAKGSQRLHGDRLLVISVAVGQPKEDGQADLDGWRDVAGNVKVLTQPEGAGWSGLGSNRWLPCAWGSDGKVGRIRVIPSAEPIMLEDHAVPRTREALRAGEGELVAIQLHMVVLPRVGLELREV